MLLNVADLFETIRPSELTGLKRMIPMYTINYTDLNSAFSICACRSENVN